jgi:polyribonucleotide nucleotidyltransferase
VAHGLGSVEDDHHFQPGSLDIPLASTVHLRYDMAAVATQSQPETSTSNSVAAAAAVFKRLHPARYLEKFLEQGHRSDGRKIQAFRDVSVNVGESSQSFCSDR